MLVSNSKVTYEDHPPSYEPNLHSEFWAIVIGGMGSTDLYKGFRTNVLFVTQSGAIIPVDIRLEQPPAYANHPIQTSALYICLVASIILLHYIIILQILLKLSTKVKLLEIKRKFRNFDCHTNRRQGNSGAYIY